MFQFPAFASYPYVFRIRYLITILGNHLSSLDHLPANDPAQMISQVSKVGFPIRISTDQRVFAPPRSFSQRITSFIACACQGIHQLPLRHLIILIANAHPDRSGQSLTEKTSFSRSVRWPAVKPPIIVEGIERSPPTHQSAKTPRQASASIPDQCPNKSSLHNVKQNRQPANRPQTFSSSIGQPQPRTPHDKPPQKDIFQRQALVELDGIEPTTPCLQSRCSPS